jgi:hypothetical protein
VLSLWGALSDERSSLSLVFSPLSKIQYNLHWTCFKYMQYILDLCQHRLSTAGYAKISATTAICTLERPYVWPPPSLSPLCFRCRASPCPIWRTFTFSWFHIISACRLHNFVIDRRCAEYWKPYAVLSQSQSYITTDSQSVSKSWCRAQSGTFDQRYIYIFLKLLSCHLGQSESESELLYGWRSVSQFVLVSSPIWDFWPEIFFFFKVSVLSFGGALSDERSGLSFVSLCQYSIQ